jgi:hypothetical protein
MLGGLAATFYNIPFCSLLSNFIRNATEEYLAAFHEGK